MWLCVLGGNFEAGERVNMKTASLYIALNLKNIEAKNSSKAPLQLDAEIYPHLRTFVINANF
jgi:hypothetical protein